MTRLEQQPTARPRSLHELMSIAAAMEGEAVRRYAHLAEAMARRGDRGLAATFQAMLEEERDHLAGVERWSLQATGAPPRPLAQSWELPPEIGRSWEEVAESALLTPYRALSIAVLNEERGFAFYAYLAAAAEDAAVRAAAEKLAAEELNHAALLRRERRRAYRRERDIAPAAKAAAPTLPEDFARRASHNEAEAAARHALLAERLAALGEGPAAASLETIAREEREAAAALSPVAVPHHAEDIAALRGRSELLRAALAESERLYDFYADLADHAGAESVLLAAQRGAARVVRHLGLIAAQLHAPADGLAP